MMGWQFNNRSWRHDLALALVALALLVRVLVPPGFMPASGQGYAIMLCTGEGMLSGWVDGAGQFHKEGKAPAQKGEHCAFAGLSAAIDSVPVDPSEALSLHLPRDAGWSRSTPARVGHGLAAPPPPSTGPPFTA